MRVLQVENLPVSEDQLDFKFYGDPFCSPNFKKLVVYVDHQNSNTYYEITYRLGNVAVEDIHRITFSNIHEALTFYNELGLK